MKRVVRSLLLFFCTTLFMLSASVCVCVVRVHADNTATYYVNDECFHGLTITNNNTPIYFHFTGTDVRIVPIHNDSYIGLYAVSKNNDLKGAAGSGGACPSSLVGYNSSKTVNGVLYYYRIVSGYLYNSTTVDINVPIINASSNSDAVDKAIEYTFGNSAVDPVEPINYGLVDVEGYQTNIAGQGQAAIHNVDVITWDDAVDTEGNDITEGNVRIRILPGEYRGSSKDDLLSKTSNDFILDIQHATAGNVVPVTDGSISYKWSDVIDALNFSSMSIFNTLHDNDSWFKRGWIYEIRLEIDDYIGEWQSIYASTSSGVENDLTIVNTTVITQNTITAIQQVNLLNNTTNTWVINGQPVDPNPEQTPPESDDEKPWWVYLLEMINNTLGIQNEYINEGTDESIEVINNFEDDHTELNTTVNDYDDIENDLVLDMNNNLEQIEVESDLIENNSFISSARWVAEQYTTIVTDNPIGSILKFSLVLGFVMIFLGRFK